MSDLNNLPPSGGVSEDACSIPALSGHVVKEGLFVSEMVIL